MEILATIPVYTYPWFYNLFMGIAGFFLTNKAIDNTSVFDYNKYKVTIDDSVSAKELLNKYEILSREGEIFTIKEIEVDEE